MTCGRSGIGVSLYEATTSCGDVDYGTLPPNRNHIRGRVTENPLAKHRLDNMPEESTAGWNPWNWKQQQRETLDRSNPSRKQSGQGYLGG